MVRYCNTTYRWQPQLELRYISPAVTGMETGAATKASQSRSFGKIARPAALGLRSTNLDAAAA